MKKFIKIFLGVLLLCVTPLYLGVIFIVPQIVNSKFTINKLQSLIHEKTGTETNIEGLNLKISPKLIIFLNIKSMNAKNNNASVANIENVALNYKLLQKHLTLVSADNIFIDGDYLKQFKKEEKKKKKNKSKLELNKIPEIHLHKIVFKSDKANIP